MCVNFNMFILCSELCIRELQWSQEMQYAWNAWKMILIAVVFYVFLSIFSCPWFWPTFGILCLYVSTLWCPNVTTRMVSLNHMRTSLCKNVKVCVCVFMHVWVRTCMRVCVYRSRCVMSMWIQYHSSQSMTSSWHHWRLWVLICPASCRDRHGWWMRNCWTCC